MVSCSAIIAEYANWDAPAMPTEPLTQCHRNKDNPLVGSFSVMVARPVGRKEVESNPEAKRAIGKEWNRLRDRPTWDEDDGHEKQEVARAAREGGYEVHFGRLHGITVEKGPSCQRSQGATKTVIPRGVLFSWVIK